ncbi:tyrosine-type recombinase/integrase [Neobacillus bataviensis]|uniref:tyrosine-type recombinase/integrase n=1 Tax=Neobacillus bataviensis TaxID=220685 RepID=UPI001CBDF6B6|nr:tyrosine-type recombinase/integrase [Neobacillus bataviensis]
MAYIEKRGADSYRLVANAGFDANGKRIRRTKTVKCKNKTEAKKELAKFVTEIEVGEYIAPEKMTFSKFVEEWKEKYASKQLAPNTYENYVTSLNCHIIPSFGHMRLDQINSFQILNFLDNLGKDGSRSDGKAGKLSSATIQFNHRILRNIFKRAVDWKVIKESPVSNIQKPKVESKKAQVYTEEQVNILMSHLLNADEKWKMIITLAITTGMRRGEILALQWDHIDLEKGKIYVKQSLTYTKENGYIFRQPKTKNSIRTISLSPNVTEQLKQFKLLKNKEKLRVGDKWEGQERFLLFSTWDGKPMYPTSITSWWRKKINEIGLPHITFHELRHTSATLLINQGVHMKTISARLGHSKIGTTMDLYGHALDSADEAAANTFDRLFSTPHKNTI